MDETVASYDQYAAEYGARWDDLRLDRALHAFASRLLDPRRVLDLGCGPGRDVDYLEQLDCWAVGLDLSRAMLAEARRRLPSAPLVLADLSSTPLAPRSFEGVWACASLLHLPRCQFPAALAEIARLLRRPGGLLFLALKRGCGQRWTVDHANRRRFFSFYQLAEVRTRLQQAGFQVVEDWTLPDQAGRDRAWIHLVARIRS